MQILITGVAGFIGYHLARFRLEQGDTVIGIDNLNDYYDVNLKQARLRQLQAFERFCFYAEDITDTSALMALFAKYEPEQTVHLAAQAGVRYSLTHPEKYVQSNLVGFANVLEACRRHAPGHLIYASTSSVYGANASQPYSEHQPTEHPLTLYAASKKANEMMAHSYSHLYHMATTGVRFFTVYGPWGRPDMAFFKFTQRILAGEPIEVFNHGQMIRDFTYVDDIIHGLSLLLTNTPTANPQWDGLHPDAGSSHAPYRIYNIGCGQPVKLLDYIEAIEQACGKEAIKKFLPMQPGDVLATHADTTRLREATGYQPRVDYREGISRFVHWYREFYETIEALV